MLMLSLWWYVFHAHTVNLLFGFQPAPARNAGADVQQFISEFEGEYGTTHPAFLQCSYSEVGMGGVGGKEGEGAWVCM